jgi:hypothetical protein
MTKPVPPCERRGRSGWGGWRQQTDGGQCRGPNRTLQGWFGCFKPVHPSELGEIDQWLRLRLRAILRKRRGGRGRGRDHHRWPNRYFTGLGLFCLLDAQDPETAGLH